jgi:hypothetical protein
LKFTSIIVCAFFVLFKTLNAQTIRFNKAIETPLNPIWGWSILINDDSTYSVISGNNDSIGIAGVFFNKIDQYGNIISSNGFVEPNKSYYAGLSNSGKRLSSGSIIIVGGVEIFTPSDQNAVLYKFNSEGDTVFKKHYDVSYKTIGQGSCVATNDDILLLGLTYDTISNNADIAIIKTDSSGNMFWAKKFGGVFYDEAYNAVEYANEKFMVFGRRNYDTQNGAPWVLKLDSSGNLLGHKWFNQYAFKCAGFTARKGINNDIIITGCLDTIINVGDASAPRFIGIIDSNFNVSIIHIFSHQKTTSPYVVKQLQDGSYVGIGIRYYPLVGYIAKVSEQGQLLWEREYVYRDSNFNYFSDFEPTPDGGFIITGSTTGDFSQDLWLVKLDSLGLLDSAPVNSSTVLVNSSNNILQLYPNPAQNQLHLKIFFTQKQYETALLTVYDMLGRQVITKNIALQQGKANHAMDVSNLQSGNYIITVQAETEMLKQKFIKE